MAPPRPCVRVVTSAPSLASIVQAVLEEQAAAFELQQHIVAGVGLPQVGRAHSADVLVLAPQTWEEMSRWLPPLKQLAKSCSWLVFTQLRVAGMFTSELPADRCTIVGTGSSLEEIQEDFRSLIRGDPLCPPAALQTRFAQGLATLSLKRAYRPLTPREFECGCAVSLQLSNPVIAQALHISNETVKRHVTCLDKKMKPASREALSILVEQALAP